MKEISNYPFAIPIEYNSKHYSYCKARQKPSQRALYLLYSSLFFCSLSNGFLHHSYDSVRVVYCVHLRLIHISSQNTPFNLRFKHGIALGGTTYRVPVNHAVYSLYCVRMVNGSIGGMFHWHVLHRAASAQQDQNSCNYPDNNAWNEHFHAGAYNLP